MGMRHHWRFDTGRFHTASHVARHVAARNVAIASAAGHVGTIAATAAGHVGTIATAATVGWWHRRWQIVTPIIIHQ